MATIRNWSKRVSNDFAYKRAGKRRQRNCQQHLEKMIRQNLLCQVCFDYNYPFVGTVRGIRKIFLKVMRERDPNYYVSHYTIVYDLQDIFGKDYPKTFQSLKASGFFYFEADLMEGLETRRSLNKKK